MALAGAAALVLIASSGQAHNDPAGCFITGPAITVAVFRANGTTGVVGSISECETINYRATLAKASNNDEICAFSQGTFKLTLPNGNVVDINLNVPCIGGTSDGCDPTVTQLQSSLIPYTVSLADIVGGFVVARAVYTGGVVHDVVGNTPGAGANTPKSTPVFRCPDNDLCADAICNPNVAGPAACQTAPILCDDNNQCTEDSCDPATGDCVFPPAVTCDDNDQCTGDVCNPATGTCVFTPNVVGSPGTELEFAL